MVCVWGVGVCVWGVMMLVLVLVPVGAGVHSFIMAGGLW